MDVRIPLPKRQDYPLCFGSTNARFLELVRTKVKQSQISKGASDARAAQQVPGKNMRLSGSNRDAISGARECG